ncbi:RICIN domain-containing protein [Lentzea sp. NPDC051213]|uniref:RICIN domain-containing protein n=1 Tax=Lentzea sp. NPDC051213 TaxID=3364126 RepID=UPI00379E4D2C
MKFAKIAAASAAALMAIGLSPVVANASDPTVQVVNTFYSLGTDRCMDDSHLGFRTFPCNPENYQKWEVIPSQGYRQFKNLATGRCITDGPRGFNTQPCVTNDRTQQWGVIKHHEVRMTFRLRDRNRCIDDSNDSGFRTTSCNGGEYQDWV